MLPFGFLAWFGFVPFIHITLNATPGNSFRLGYLAGSVANLVAVYWIGFNSGAVFITALASMIGAILYLGIFWGLFALVISWLNVKTGRGLVLWPLLWVLMEYVRSFGAMGFPWINLATTQAGYLPLIQLAEITGSYGIAFWIISINVLIYRALTSQTKTKLALIYGAVIFLLVFITGLLRIDYLKDIDHSQSIDIAIVQPNLNPNDKWKSEKRENVFNLMDSTLVEALALKPQLVIWPESAVPAYLRTNKYRSRRIEKRVFDAGIPLLTGAVDRLKQDNGEWSVYNGSILYKPDSTQTIYHKMHLVPFAEYIPLSGEFPVLKKLNFGQGNFAHGEMFTIFEVDSVRFSNIICYESSIPQLVRKFVGAGARMITIETNDAWVGQTSGPYQHYALAVLRAVENRVPVVRCANTGISGYIDITGKTTNKIPLNELGIVKQVVNIPSRVSLYARFGDIFVFVNFLIMIIISGVGWKRKY